jgi:hypothetical protein
VSTLKPGWVPCASNQGRSIAHFLKMIPQDSYQVMPVGGYSVDTAEAVAPKEMKDLQSDDDYQCHTLHAAKAACNPNVSW